MRAESARLNFFDMDPDNFGCVVCMMPLCHDSFTCAQQRLMAMVSA